MADTKKLKPDELEREPELARSYSVPFAVLSLIFMACCVWIVWDETVTRRPWKRYQAESRLLEEHLLNTALTDVRDEFSRTGRRQQIDETEAAFDDAAMVYGSSVETNQVLADVEALEDEIYEAQQAFQQARSALQEAEYWWEKSGLAEAKEKITRLTPEVAKLRDTYDRLTEKKTSLFDRLEELGAGKRELQEQLDALRKPELDLLRRLDAGVARPTEIRQIHIEELDAVDRCESCHTGVRDTLFADAIQPFTTHPKIFSLWREDLGGDFSWKGILDVHPPERFGCTTCHRGQGYATTSPEKAHGDVEFWPAPMLRGEFVQASCLKCHQDIENLPGAELLAHGKWLFDRYGCHNCHIAKGYEDSRKVAPNLGIIGSKVTREWLVDWLKEPKHYLPKTIMPNFLLSEEEVEHIADFLMTFRSEDERELKWPAWAKEPWEDLEDAEFDAFDELVLAGEGVWGEARCSICHARRGEGGATGLCPDLGQIATKVNRNWLYRWVQHPKALNPNTQMPHFRFTDEELHALVEYIVRGEDFGPGEGQYPALSASFPPHVADGLSIAEGRRLVEYYQCYGCHRIPGYPEKLKLCVELSYHGSKPIEELDFGRKEGRIPHTRAGWFMEKLRDPRGFREGLKMPDFGFSQRDLEAIAVLLVGNTREEVVESHRVSAPKFPYDPPAEFGEIVADINCFACHRINQRGGTYAPDLTIEGSKVRRDWLKKFFKSPDVLRPLLKQMPHFNLTDQEAEILAEHVKVTMVDPGIPHNFLPGKPSGVDVAKGRELYFKKGCHACHQIGADGGAVGPVLTDAGDRLEKGYIFAYLRNPHGFRPEAAEPNYGLSEEETILLTEFVSSLRETSEAEE